MCGLWLDLVCLRKKQKVMRIHKFLRALFSYENLLALALALIMIALVIFTADTSPTWIYQGC